MRIVWFEEGDAAALLEDDDLLAVIPGWSGQGGFCGYARDCTNTTQICWPLSGAFEKMRARVSAAEEYCASRDDETDPWTKMQNAFIAAYETIQDVMRMASYMSAQTDLP